MLWLAHVYLQSPKQKNKHKLFISRLSPVTTFLCFFKSKTPGKMISSRRPQYFGSHAPWNHANGTSHCSPETALAKVNKGLLVKSVATLAASDSVGHCCLLPLGLRVARWCRAPLLPQLSLLVSTARSGSSPGFTHSLVTSVPGLLHCRVCICLCLLTFLMNAIPKYLSLSTATAMLKPNRTQT